MKAQKTKTLGEILLEETRKKWCVNLTSFYWGSTIYYKKKYIVKDYTQGWGGMVAFRQRRFSASEIAACKTYEELEELLAPVADLAPGDPLCYTPRCIRRVPLKWRPQSL